jgi:hypothetical protein
VSGFTTFRLSYSVGTQYADESTGSSHDVRPPISDAGVADASTVRFPTKVWLCERPGCSGKRIGSSFGRWLKLHPIAK